MRYFLCVSLERFYTRSLKARTAISCACIVRERAVLDADEEAQARGVRAGMDQRVAKAILGSATYLGWNREDFEAAQKAWLDRCVPFTDIIEPSDQHQAYLDLSGHPDPREAARGIITALREPARFGAGPSKWIAGIASRKAALGSVEDTAVFDPSGFLAQLPIEELAPVPWEHRERLRFLGYRLIGEIADLPFSVLKGQFGADALAIRQASQGKLHDSVQARYPPQSISETVSFEGGLDDLSMLDAALQSLAKKLGERLIEREMQGFEIRLYAELESGPIVTAKRCFQKAVRCERSAYSALRLLLPSFDEPVTRLKVLLPELTRSQRVQRDLLSAMPECQKGASVNAALRSLAAVYGDQTVHPASEVAVPRRMLVLREWRNATGWR